MVKIRLKRLGRKKAAFYRIVVTDSRVQRDGKYLELVGTYNPLNGHTIINKDVAIKWLAWGAQPTLSAKSLLSKSGVLSQFAKQNAIKKQSATITKNIPKK